jgi:gliding motility-associated-like protein
MVITNKLLIIFLLVLCCSNIYAGKPTHASGVFKHSMYGNRLIINQLHVKLTHTSLPLVRSESNRSITITIDTSQMVVTPPTCNLNNGAITGIVVNGATTIQWLNSAGTVVQANNSANISGLAAGTYHLYASNSTGSLQGPPIIVKVRPLLITSQSFTAVGDQCNMASGSLEVAVTLSGGLPPYAYSWINSKGDTLSHQFKLTGLVADVYTFIITDKSTCDKITIPFTIGNNVIFISPPGVQVAPDCGSSNTVITVNPLTAGYGYKLFNSLNATEPISANTKGSFTVKAGNNQNYYVSQYQGGCESTRTEVNLTVALQTINIPNTITPNGDGINDYWQINGIENYPNALVQIFNRYGQKIFESKGYSVPFDGTYKGQKLPSGVYYYIINLITTCNLFSGSLTIVR